MSETLLFNLKAKKQKRRELRQQEISCEKIMWYHLRNRGLCDLKFRRQFSIDKYIVDFYCPEINLVIEIDGATHGTEEEIKYDKQRQKYLESLGLYVKRCTNTEIKENINEVITDLQETCENLTKTNLTPPSPSQGEER